MAAQPCKNNKNRGTVPFKWVLYVSHITIELLQTKPKTLHKNVYSSWVHNPELDTTSTSSDGWTVEQMWDIHLGSTTQPQRGRSTDTPNSVGVSCSNYAEWKKPIPTGPTPHDSLRDVLESDKMIGMKSRLPGIRKGGGVRDPCGCERLTWGVSGW